MPQSRKPQADTIARVAEEFLGLPLSETDRKAVTELVGSLSDDMRAVRAMRLGEAEPATIYQPEGK
jgi:hypothetical protein